MVTYDGKSKPTFKLTAQQHTRVDDAVCRIQSSVQGFPFPPDCERATDLYFGIPL